MPRKKAEPDEVGPTPAGPLDPAKAQPFDEREFVLMAGQAMSLQHAPIVYLHPFEGVGPTMVLVEFEYWKKLLDNMPEGEDTTALVMNHGHIEPEEG